jgi:transcriptional regulator with XRE-family HTH domain
MIDYYERRAGNPSLDFIQRAAEALDVSVAELLGSQPKATRGKPGPPPHLQLRFDQIRRLPRKEQEFVTLHRYCEGSEGVRSKDYFLL